MTPAERYQKIIGNVRVMAGKDASNQEILSYLRYEGLSGKEFISLLEGPTVLGQVGEAIKGIPAGAVGLVEQAAIGASALLPDDMETGVRETIASTAAAARRPFEADPGYEETVGRKLGEAGGSFIPFLATLPFGLPGVGVALGLGVGAGAGEARTRAEQEGATEEQRATATALGTIPGALELFAPFRILRRIPEGEVVSGVERVKRAFIAGGEEGAQEAASAVAQNLIAREVYKPNQELIEGVGEQASYGAAVGAIAQGLFDLAIPGKQRGAAPSPTQPTEPTQTQVGVPADAKQLDLFSEEEIPVALTPDESVYAIREESMVDEGRRQQALNDADELRRTFDILQRENERLAADFGRATTDEERAEAKKKAEELAPQLEQIKSELQKVERKLPKEERGRATAPPEQMALDFDMPLMERQKTGEGVVLGETPEAEPQGLTPEQQTFFDESKLNAIRQRIEDGQPVTDADRARLRLAEREQRQEFEAAPTPELIAPEEKPEARPPFGLQRTDIEQPSAAPREPITVTPEGEAIIGRPEVEERRVSEDDFTQMGIGKTNKKLREQLIGKDLADPAQRGEVRATLEDFANAPNRSEKLRTGVENFLSQPMFMEQMGLDLQPRREPDDGGPTGPVGPRGKPSISPPSGEEAAPTGAGPSVTEGMGFISDVSGVPDAGEGIQPNPIRQKQRKDFGKAIGAVDTGILRGRKNPQLARAMEAGDSRGVLDILSESKNPIYRWLANKAKAIPSLKFKVGDETETSQRDLDAQLEVALVNVAELELMRKAKPEVDAQEGDGLPYLGNYSQDVLMTIRDIYLGKKGTQRLTLDTTLYTDKAGFNERLNFLEQNVAPNADRIKSMADFMGSRVEVAGAYDLVTNTVSAVDIYANREDVVAHEIGHALTANAIKRPNATQKPIVQKLKTLYETVKNHPLIKDDYGASSLDEFVAEGWGNPEFKLKLSQIKYEASTAWGKFTEYVAKLLGLKKDNAFVEFMALGESLVESANLKAPPSKKFIDNARRAYMDQKGRNDPVWAQLSEQRKNDWYDTYEMDTQEPRYEVDPNAPKLYRLEKVSVTPEGQAALNTLDQMGRKYEPPKKGFFGRTKQDDSKISQESSRSAVTKFLDQIQTWTFSTDAALNNEIRRQQNESTKSNQDKIGALLNISMSQTVHDDAVGSLMLTHGKVVFDPNMYKYVAVDDRNNFVTLAAEIQQIANQYGLTLDQAEKVAHNAFEARRLQGLKEYNAQVQTEVEKLNSQNRKAAAERRAQDVKFIHMSDEQIAKGVSLFDQIPELNNLVDTWNGVRANTLDMMVTSGLYTPEEADFLLTKRDYVPFIREEQIEDGKGPKEFLTGLGVNAKEKGFKGSDQTVNDIFNNMARWTQYAVKRAVRNRNAVALVDAAVENGLAKKVDGPSRGGNTVKVWRNGIEEFYDMADPLYMEAFKGLESIAIPTLGVLSKFANFLRQSVVLYPLFSVAQVPQDAFAAIFSSGLKTRYALTIPARVVKEYIKTLAGTSRTNAELKRYGVVGVRDFTAAVARMDTEIYSGLRQQTGMKGILESVKRKLEHIAMASDNAVRQAVYEAAIDQGLTKAEALEKAFEIINFRRRGTSKSLAMMAQVIPFLNAYLAAQNVAIKTISGVGISPGDRGAALRTLATTTGSVMALSLIYAMLIADDEDYQNKPSVIRDRLLMIPGTGGLSVPLRPDIFSLPKILTEHTYLMMTDNGTQDGRKFRDSMTAAVVNAISSPTAIPQAIKPFFEVGINYNFFQGRPLVGMYQQNLELGRQFNDSTSELAKLLGSTNLVSPIAVDHVIRGMLGTTGGLLLYMTNGMLQNDPFVPRPELSFQDAIATFPGMSPFVSREDGTALKNDFYVLREEVDRAVDTANDLVRRSPQDVLEYLADEKNVNRIGLRKTINAISNELGEIRRTISEVTNSAQFNAQQKQEMVKELRDYERQILNRVDLKELRRIAQL
jgi:hypothetical protein